MAKISKGKYRGIEAVADSRGVVRAAAMDQRGSLQKAIAKAKGVAESDVTPEMMSEFKYVVINALSQHASGVLLDPEFGLEAAKARHSAGLLLAYEKTGYDNSEGGRLPLLLNDQTVSRLQAAGADCIKLLLYYDPYDVAGINDQKHVFVERVGAECKAQDMPFFLEFVSYDRNGDSKGVDYARRKPQIVADCTKEFSKPVYNVDVLKIEVPINMEYVSGTAAFKGGEAAYSREEAKDHFRRAAEAAKLPFIYLSAGVSDAIFRETLQLAIESGAPFSGVLCGRATWQDGIPVYAQHGRNALEDWVMDRGVKNIEALNEVLTGAHSWKNFYGGNIEVV